MLLNDVRVYFKRFWTGIMPEREDMEVAIIHHRRKMMVESNGKNASVPESQKK
jgi:hypothetical protein